MVRILHGMAPYGAYRPLIKWTNLLILKEKSEWHGVCTSSLVYKMVFKTADINATVNQHIN